MCKSLELNLIKNLASELPDNKPNESINQNYICVHTII